MEYMKLSKMLRFTPLMISDAVTKTTISAVFIPMMVTILRSDTNIDERYRLNKGFLAMIPLGFAQVLGSMIFGRILDKFKHKIALFVMFATCITAYCFAFGLLLEWDFSQPLIYPMVFLFGLMDSFWSIFIQVVCGFEFDSKTIPFSVSKVVQSLSFLVFLIVASLLSTQASYIAFFLFSLGFSLVSVGMMLRFEFKESLKSVNNVELSTTLTNH